MARNIAQANMHEKNKFPLIQPELAALILFFPAIASHFKPQLFASSTQQPRQKTACIPRFFGIIPPAATLSTTSTFRLRMANAPPLP